MRNLAFLPLSFPYTYRPTDTRTCIREEKSPHVSRISLVVPGDMYTRRSPKHAKLILPCQMNQNACLYMVSYDLQAVYKTIMFRSNPQILSRLSKQAVKIQETFHSIRSRLIFFWILLICQKHSAKSINPRSMLRKLTLQNRNSTARLFFIL